MKDDGLDEYEDYDKQGTGSRRKKKQINKNVTFKEEAKKAKAKASGIFEKPI